jgi:cellulose synthase/poly-beta-1,6-N-acetylglucosamine synthase-like glycosyltransferase
MITTGVSHAVMSFAFLAPGSNRLIDSLFDDTFAGIHRLEWFDYALMLPYFGVLIILSVYGLHRYEMIREYFKTKHKIPTEPASRFTELPRITIQLPLFNERFVVDRLVEGICKIDYPKDKLQIQILDDSTDETHAYASGLVADYQSNGYPIEYIHRTNRHGYKAGALQEGMERATGEFIAIFDADFVPPTDFLMKTIHFFTEEKVGMVQTRWGYLNRHENVLTEVQAMLLDGHFVLEHCARSGSGLFFNFNGTAGVWRRSAIDEAGGWEHDTLTEDSDLSYRAQLAGWKFVYVPSIECPSELPADTYGFQVQQSRWAKGLTQVAMKLLTRIMKSDIPLRAKAEAFFHLTPNISYPLMIIMSALMLPVMIVRFYMGPWQMLMLDLPLMAASFWSISAFYVVAQRELFPKTWKRSFFFLPALMAAGVALTLINAKAVLEALFGYQTAFARTPKMGDVSAAAKLRIEGEKPKALRYRRRSGWLPVCELAMGSFFMWMILYAIDTYNFLAVPFLLLFVGGYYWAGFSTLWEEYRGRVAFEKAQAAVGAQKQIAD